MISRMDVRFFEEVPGYPKLMGGRAPQVQEAAEKHFFYLFPDPEDEPAAPVVPAAAVHPNMPAAAVHPNMPAAAVLQPMPAVLQPIPAPVEPVVLDPAAANDYPYDNFQPQAAEVPNVTIELSDSQSGINNAGGGDAGEEEVQGGGANPEVGERGSVADRVMARRRANFAEYGDLM